MLRSLHMKLVMIMVLLILSLMTVVGAFLIIPIVGNFNNMVTAFFVSGAYTACSILVMIIMSNMCYRYGIAAMWLFGIERTVRMAFNGAGRTAHDVLLNAPSGLDMPYVLPAIVIILAVVSTMVLLSCLLYTSDAADE